MKKLDVLMAIDGLSPFPGEESFDDLAGTADWATEIGVYRALKALGHEVRFVSFYDDVTPLVSEVTARRPDVVFNLAEACLGEYRFDKNLPSLLELLRIPYTGCGPMGLMICNNKALTKKVLMYHDIKVPRFSVYQAGETVKFPRVFDPPFFVKPLQEEASVGIAQRSVALTQEQCRERVGFVHGHLKKDALVEEYIEGRELYVGVIGNGKNVRVQPVWELKFSRMPDDGQKIATYRVKWDDAYRRKWGITNEHADPLPGGIEEKIRETCCKAYRVLNIDGYARFDLRLTAGGEVFIIEANANPELARGEDFAASAEKGGTRYEELIEKILQLALSR
ncbi:MAG: D-alanine--D-alanine ligase family protein [Endomicrobiales bacterium]